jgi:conjugative relaxase-like TrwC/TraI family protein
VLSVGLGYDIGYVLKEVAQARENYYTSAVETAGEPNGQWFGAGAAELGLSGDVDHAVMEQVYNQLRDPRSADKTLGAPHKQFKSAKELHAALLAGEPGPVSAERQAELWQQAERSARQAILHVDATFSAPKSVSVLGVALERAAVEAEQAGRVEEAEAWRVQHRAVEEAVVVGSRAAVEYLEDVAGYGRVGKHGQGADRWTDSHRWVVTSWLQHDSRERDPQLHVHNPILNRQLCADGQWRGLDVKAILLHKPAAGAVGERAMEAHLARVLGVRFETRPDGMAREIVGVSQDLMDVFSARTRAITPKVEALCRDWERLHGRPPNALERSRIAQNVTLLTRPGKRHDGETNEQRLRRWEQQTRDEVGRGLSAVAAQVLAARQDAGADARWDPADVVSRAVERVAASKAFWTRADLMRAVSDCLPANLGVEPGRARELLDELTDVAAAEVVRLSPAVDLSDRPAEHLLADGGDVYARPGSASYAAPWQVLAERKLRDAAVERGAERVDDRVVDELLARYAEHGVELGHDQAAAVRGVLTSGALVEIVSAPAGSGKTVIVGALAQAWADHGRQVVGLAPSQVAADVMSDEGVRAVNVDRWLMGDPGIGQGDIVVFDEAGMARTEHLTAVHERCRAVGAKLLLVGDPAQLGAVGPGGALSDLVTRAQSYGLAEVRRFRDDWQGPASLDLRAGDSRCLDEYDGRGALRAGGTEEQAEASALRAWLADTLEGRESLLLVQSNQAADRVSAAARAELVRLGVVAEDGVALGRDGNTAGVGDVVQARRNGWHIGGPRVPINRATYRVVEACEDGSLVAAPIIGGQEGAAITLPARYVAEHVSLAYASTVHAAQGRTVDTGHAVLSAGAQLSQAYVALTRGREQNTAWAVTVATPPDSPPGQASEVKERAARAVLADVLDRDQRDRTAMAEQEALEAEAGSERAIVGQLLDGIERSTAGQTSDLLDRLAARGAITDAQRQMLANDEAMSAVERLLRHAELRGQDRAALLDEALDGRSLASARSVGQVLHHRLHHVLDLDTTIGGFRDLIPGNVQPYHRAWLENRADDADTRRHELGTLAADEQPGWAVSALGPVPEDVVERQEWERRAGWAATYREMSGFDHDTDPLGPAPPSGLSEKHAVWRTAHQHLGLEERGPDEGRMSEGLLRARVAAWERERTWAPAVVKQQWAETSLAADEKRVDGVLRGHHQDPTALDAEAESVALADTAGQLEEAEQARRRWVEHTAQTRENAERAAAELRARDVEPQDAAARVTGQEWLDSQRAAQAAEDEHREIDTLADDHRETVETDGVLETAVDDIRDAAERHPSEDAMPERRPATTQEAADAVRRAQEALAELAARDEYDAEHEYVADVVDEPVDDDAVAAWT